MGVPIPATVLPTSGDVFSPKTKHARCIQGLVGSKLPKFSIFGDTMNTASRYSILCCICPSMKAGLTACSMLQLDIIGMLRTNTITVDTHGLSLLRLRALPGLVPHATTCAHVSHAMHTRLMAAWTPAGLHRRTPHSNSTHVCFSVLCIELLIFAFALLFAG